MSARDTGPGASALTRLRCIILAGGASSRFFPLNKILADPTGSGRSLLEQTFDRVAAPLDGAECVAPENVFAVTGEEIASEVREQLPTPAENVLVEPDRRNTWPAILWALAHVRLRDPHAVVAVLPADQFVAPVEAYRETLGAMALQAEREDGIVTIGVRPDEELARWTSFGTIRERAGASSSSASSSASSQPESGACGEGLAAIERFEEKPSTERAQEMLAEGGWLWNSGIFVFRVTVAEKLLGTLQPGMAAVYEDIVAALAVDDRDRAAASFSRFPSKVPHPSRIGETADNSIDFAIVQPLTTRGVEGVVARVARASFDWSDLGSWDALGGIVDVDRDGNLCVGDVEAFDARGCILVAEPGWRIVARDLNDTVVVVSRRGNVLVSSRQGASQIRPLVEGLGQTPEGSVVYRGARDCRVERGKRAVDVAVHDVAELEVLAGDDVVEVRRRESVRDVIAASLAQSVERLSPCVRRHAWGGTALESLLRFRREVGERLSEVWLTSVQRTHEVTLQRTSWTLREWVAAQPEILGDWSRRLFGDRLPIFVKLLSTRFAPRVHVGFERSRVAATEAQTRQAFEDAVRSWAQEEWDDLRGVFERLASDAIATDDVFERFRKVYEAWAVRQGESSWRDEACDREFVATLRPFLRREIQESGTAVEEFLEQVTRLRHRRARLVACLNEIDLRQIDGHALLCPSGSPHAIFGLSHQSHPVDPARAALAEIFTSLRERAEAGASDDELRAVVDAARTRLDEARNLRTAPPKSEAWIPFTLGEEAGDDGEVIIVEPQQTSDVTHSWLDLYTTFVLRDGQLGFRKGDAKRGLSEKELDAALSEVDFGSCDPQSLLRDPQPVRREGESRGAQLFRLIDEPEVWPFFTVYRVDLASSGDREAFWRGDHPAGAFQQIVPVRGCIQLVAGDRNVELHAGAPAFVPATLQGGYELRAREPATVLLVSVPTPRPFAPPK